MSKYRKLGRLLMVARKARGLSREQVATRTGLDQSSLARIERGDRRPSLPCLARLDGVLSFGAAAALDALDVPSVVVEPSVRIVPELRERKLGKWGAFGVRLARARRAAQLTQASLAQVLDCTRRQVARIEAGKVLPSVWRFALMRQVLRLDVDELLTLVREVPVMPFVGFGQVLVSARRELSMSPPQVATAARCELGLYLGIERGEQLPSMRAAVRIHQVIRFDANAAMRSVWQSSALDRMN